MNPVERVYAIGSLEEEAFRVRSSGSDTVKGSLVWKDAESSRKYFLLLREIDLLRRTLSANAGRDPALP